MANKFAEDIRRIAKGTRFKEPLGVYSPRDPIGPHQVSLITDPMALGGGYGDGGLNNETPTSEAPNSDTEQTDKEGGQTRAQDPNNPNSFYKGGAGDGTDSAAGEGSFDVEDVIDGTDGPQTSIDGTSGGINEFTGMTDCDTGDCFNFHPDGFFPAPEGWDDAETPPEIDGWTLGKRYVSSGDDNPGFPCGTIPLDGTTYFYNRAGADTHAEAQCQIVADAYFACDGRETQVIQSGPNTWAAQSRIGVSFTTVYQRGVSQESCDVDVDDFCPSSAPLEESWPEDDCYDLANIDGKIQTSDFDGDKPGDYSSSAKDFCFGDGRTGKMLVTADGGTMVYETDNGAPTGTAKVYAPDGTMRAAGDATDSFTSQYLPK